MILGMYTKIGRWKERTYHSIGHVGIIISTGSEWAAETQQS
jgi:hypothetical protein